MPCDLERKVCSLAKTFKPKLSRNAFLLQILYHYLSGSVPVPSVQILVDIYPKVLDGQIPKTKFVFYVTGEILLFLDTLFPNVAKDFHHFGIFLPMSRNKLIVILVYHYITTLAHVV